MSSLDFANLFRKITGHEPGDYQVRLAERLAQGESPSHLNALIRMGKTLMVLIGWLYVLTQDAKQVGRRHRKRVASLKLHLVVDRCVVVDDSFEATLRIKEALGEGAGDRLTVRYVAETPRSASVIPAGAGVSRVRRLRSGFADTDRDLTGHTRYPSRPAIIVGTLSMTVSCLLFRGHQLSPCHYSINVVLTRMDVFWVFDEVHLSEQTLTILYVLHSEESRLEDRCGGSVLGLRVMPMTATPVTLPTLRRGASRESTPGLSLDWEEECRPGLQLAARWAHCDGVPVEAHYVEGKVAAALTEQTCTCMKKLSQGESLIAFCNTLNTAKKVVAGLRKQVRRLKDQAPHMDAMVDGMPAHCGEHVAEGPSPYWTGTKGHQDAQAIVVMAASILEVGTDLDFTRFLTGGCQTGSPMQRLGRISRVGACLDGSAAIVRSTTSQDLIHGGTADAAVELIDGVTTLGGVVKRLSETGGWEGPVDTTQVPAIIPSSVFTAYLHTLESRSDAPVHPRIRPLADSRPDTFIVFRKNVGNLTDVSSKAPQEGLARWRPDPRAGAWGIPLNDTQEIAKRAVKTQPLVTIDPTSQKPRTLEAGDSLPGLVPSQILVLTPSDGSNPYGLEGVGRDYSEQHVMPGVTAEEVFKELVSLTTGTDRGTNRREEVILADLSGGGLRTDGPYADLLEEAVLLAVPPG